MEKTLFKSNLFTGSLELNNSENLLTNNLLNLFNPLITKYGLVITQDFSQILSANWLVSQQTPNSININAGNAIVQDADGNTARITLASNTVLTMPASDGTYNIFLKQSNTNNEPGTIAFTNGLNLVEGTGTKFTQVFAVNRLLITNNTAYHVIQVNSDTELELDQTYPGVSVAGLNFAVGGWFTTQNVSLPDNYIYQHDAPTLTITTGAIGTYQYWLAQVTMTGGIITSIVDKRSQNIFSTYSEIPKFNWTQARNRHVSVYKPSLLNSGTVNAVVTTMPPQVLANSSFPSSFQPVFGQTFLRTSDDKQLVVNFSSLVTDTGLALSAGQQVGFQIRVDIDGVAGAPINLNTNTCTVDISALTAGYHTLYIKLASITGFNLSVYINEIYLTGNLNLIIAS
jgi:hypothetical protein